MYRLAVRLSEKEEINCFLDQHISQLLYMNLLDQIESVAGTSFWHLERSRFSAVSLLDYYFPCEFPRQQEDMLSAFDHVLLFLDAEESMIPDRTVMYVSARCIEIILKTCRFADFFLKENDLKGHGYDIFSYPVVEARRTIIVKSLYEQLGSEKKVASVMKKFEDVRNFNEILFPKTGVPSGAGHERDTEKAVQDSFLIPPSWYT